MLWSFLLLTKEGVPAGKDASMSEVTVATGSLATPVGAQHLLNALASLPEELCERLVPQVNRIAELVGRFFAGRTDAPEQLSVRTGLAEHVARSRAGHAGVHLQRGGAAE